MASRTPIGVFDSGLGGLSVLRELVRRLPDEDFVYVADSSHCPYGGKTQEQIIARACAISDFLLARGSKLIVVACNTATIAAVEYLRANYSIHFVAMEPAVKPAVALTRSGVVGVLATAATLSGEKLHRLIDRHAGKVKVVTQPCPGLPERVGGGRAGERGNARPGRTLYRASARRRRRRDGAGQHPLSLSAAADPAGGRRRREAARYRRGRRAAGGGRAGGQRQRRGSARAAGRWAGAHRVVHQRRLREHMQTIGSRLWGLPIVASALPS